MRKIFGILGCSMITVFSLLSFAFSADAENLTIATYFPPPHGVYSTMRLTPNTNFTPGDACANIGELSYHQTENKVYVCNGNWVPLAPVQQEAGPSNCRWEKATSYLTLQQVRDHKVNSSLCYFYAGASRFMYVGRLAGNAYNLGPDVVVCLYNIGDSRRRNVPPGEPMYYLRCDEEVN